MHKQPKMLTINEWCTEYGIKVHKPTGFKGRKNRIWNNKYTRNQFRKGLKTSQITINTEKGLAFYELFKVN